MTNEEEMKYVRDRFLSKWFEGKDIFGILGDISPLGSRNYRGHVNGNGYYLLDMDGNNLAGPYSNISIHHDGTIDGTKTIENNWDYSVDQVDQLDQEDGHVVRQERVRRAAPRAK